MVTHKDIEEMITDVFRDSVPNFGLEIEVTSTYNDYDIREGSSGLMIRMKDGSEFEIEITQK